MSNRSGVAILAVGAALGLFLGAGSHPETKLTFLAVGQGDCIVFQHGGRTILVDGGPMSGTFDAGERIVKPRLRQLGVARIDLIVLTHPDLDHAGGVGTLLKRHPEAKLAVSNGYRTDAELRGYLKGWKLPEERVVWLPTEANLTLGDFTIRLASPSVPEGSGSNDGSVMMRISGQGASAVLTGDAPSDVEDAYVASGDWRAQVLKAGHHGSRSSASSAWLKAVAPEWVVFSCGRDNRYGHPAKDVIARAEAAGASIARTDREGDITFVVRDGRFVRLR